MPKQDRWTEADVVAYHLRQGHAPLTQAASPDQDRGGREAAFQARILQVAKTHGWLCYHAFDARRSEAGFPDLVMVRDSILFCELKSTQGKLTAQQQRWLSMLERTGQVEVYCWRIRDWQTIYARLTRPWGGGMQRKEVP